MIRLNGFTQTLPDNSYKLVATLTSHQDLSPVCKDRTPSQCPFKKSQVPMRGRLQASGATRSSASSSIGKPQSKIKPTGTKPAIQITDKCTKSVTAWRDKGESLSLRVDRHQRIALAVRCLHLDMSKKIKVTKTETAMKQEPYSVSDLKQDLKCGFVKFGDITSIVALSAFSISNTLLLSSVVAQLDAVRSASSRTLFARVSWS
jgi:hypothetical protein